MWDKVADISKDFVNLWYDKRENQGVLHPDPSIDKLRLWATVRRSHTESRMKSLMQVFVLRVRAHQRRVYLGMRRGTDRQQEWQGYGLWQGGGGGVPSGRSWDSPLEGCTRRALP